MADDDLLRYPLPPGFSEEPATKITVRPVPPAPPPTLPIANDGSDGSGLSPLTALDPAMFPPADTLAPGAGGQGGPPLAGARPPLTPVEHNPFEDTLRQPLSGQVLVPVDYDPFNPFDVAAIRTKASVLRDKQPVADDRSKMLSRLLDVTLGRNGTERFQFFPERWLRAAIGEFDRAAQGQFPDTVYVQPGQMVTEDMLASRRAEMNAGVEGAANFAMMGGPLNMIALGARPGGATLSSGFNEPLYHGSPRPDLSFINPSTRGPMGGGVYTTPQPNTARLYAGADGTVYELPAGTRDIYRGNGHRTDEEWFGYKQDRERLIAAADPEKRPEVEAIVDKMGSADGYPLFRRLANLYGSDEAAQQLFRRAGFDGISGIVDGHEVLLFGPRSQPSGRRSGMTLGTAGAEDGKGRVSLGPVVPAPPFYSAVEQAVDNASMKQASPEQWLGTLKNAKGVKPEEMQWIGLEDWLKDQKGPVTKQQVADFVRQNKVQLKEVQKFDPESDAFMEASVALVDEVADKMMDDWMANAHALARGDGVTLRPGPVGGGGYEVRAFGHVVWRSPNRESANAMAREFMEAAAEAANGNNAKLTNFAMEAAEYAAAKDRETLEARHGSSGRKLPGGENYRELLLTLPPQPTPWKEVAPGVFKSGDVEIRRVRQSGKESFDIYYEGTLRERRSNFDDAKEAAARSFGALSENLFRMAGHWNEPNVLAWARADDRVIQHAPTAEESAAINARTEAQRQLDELKPQTDAAAIAVQRAAARLENAREQRIRDDLKAGRITPLAARKAMEEFVEKPELKPLQDRLRELREKEDAIRAAMPPEPNLGSKSLFIEEIQSDWHQQGREHGYKVAPEKARADTLAARKRWMAERGYRDIDQMKPEEYQAWTAALEARNPEVFDLSLKALDSRLAWTEALKDSFRRFTREEMGEDNFNALPSKFEANKSAEELLPSNVRGVNDFASVDLLTPAQRDRILARQRAWMEAPEYRALQDKAEADQRALEAAQRKNIRGVPDAPLKKTWHEMVLKRMIREAAEKGYDSLSWTTGTQQNKRWGLANFVREIAYNPKTHEFVAEGDRRIVENVPPEKLPEMIGKDAAKKLLAQPLAKPIELVAVPRGIQAIVDKMFPGQSGRHPWMVGGAQIDASVGSSRITTAEADKLNRWLADNPEPEDRLSHSRYAGMHVLRGQDLEIGGAGMKGFYDKMLVDAANKIAKPFGGKVSSGKINAAETVHTLDITPAMRDAAVGKGFPLFISGVPVVRVDHNPFAEDDSKKAGRQ